MVEDECVLEAVVDLTPPDPWEVIAGEPPTDKQGRPLPHGLRPEGSFEVAWRLAH